jgi:cytochrome c peroxidase
VNPRRSPHGLVVALLLSACAPAAAPEASVALPDASADRVEAAADVPDARAAADAAAPRCVNGAALPYPEASGAVSERSPLADLRFETATGSTVALRQWYAPCAEAPRLLVIRTLAAWSGRSQHAAAHTGRLLAHPQRDRVALLDLVALGPDNTPATSADLAAWSARYDRSPDALAVDPAYRFQSLYAAAGEAPLYALVDTRTMRIAAVLEAPSSAVVTAAITRSLAAMDGLPRPPSTVEALVDGRFTRDDWELLQAMSPPPAAPPPDPTNRVADDPRAARLGESLFQDTGLSSNGEVSCATCHASASLYTDARPQGVGLARGDRNTPTVLLAPHARWMFHDGRADTLWAQALGPIENPLEMASTRLAAAHRLADRYASAYAALFGPLPPLSDAARFPAQGAPGAAAWDAMAASDRDAVDRVFVNMGKAIAAYERSLRYPGTAFDRYVAGDVSALTGSQRDGLQSFLVHGCVQCHHGPRMSDDSFHNVGMPTGRRDGMPDRGRIDALATLLGSPFRSDGVFSDDRTPGPHLGRVRADPSMLGQFHTPSLRGVSRTGPWGHGGTFSSLADVVRHYASGLQLPPVAGTTGTRDLHLLWFVDTDNTVGPMVELLEAL